MLMINIITSNIIVIIAVTIANIVATTLIATVPTYHSYITNILLLYTIYTYMIYDINEQLIYIYNQKSVSRMFCNIKCICIIRSDMLLNYLLKN